MMPMGSRRCNFTSESDSTNPAVSADSVLEASPSPLEQLLDRGVSGGQL